MVYPRYGLSEKLRAREVDQSEFETARGVVTAPLTNDVLYRINGRETSFPTAIGRPGSRPILGATLLEELNLLPDPVRKRLVKRRAYYAYYQGGL